MVRGLVVATMASKFHRLGYMLLDLDYELAGAGAEIPPQVSDPVSLVVHGFFNDKAPIFHIWSDTYRVKLFAQIGRKN